MKQLSLFLTFLFALNAQSQTITVDTGEATRAYEYLNKVRQNPAAYSNEIGVDMSDYEVQSALNWSSVLAVVAQQKAADMAERGYFGHVSPDGIGVNYLIHQAGYELPEVWLDKKSNNYFESISAGHGDGVMVIRDLILDEGVNPPGHRHHLLGMKDFWKNCTDVGIGIVKAPGTVYGHYAVIIIAKQDW